MTLERKDINSGAVDGTKPPTTRSREFTLVERAKLKTAEVLMRNYSSSLQAIHDLVDNGVDNRFPGKPTEITIKFDRIQGKSQVLIRNVGGKGLDQEGLQSFLEWGKSDKKDEIGQYGVGGKAAIGFLGDTVDVNCSPDGSHIGYHVHFDGFRDKGDSHEKTHKGNIGSVPDTNGFFSVQINGVDVPLPDEAKLIRALADTYKPLLQSGEVRIAVNRKPVIPQETKCLEDTQFAPETIVIDYSKPREERSKHAEWIRIGVAEVEPKDYDDTGLKIYYRGRLIDVNPQRRNFGLPRIPQARRVTGEVHLSNVDVTPNKGDIIDNEKWRRAVANISEALKERGWHEKVEALKQETRRHLGERDFKIAQEAKRLLEGILANVEDLDFFEDVPGQSGGRLPATKRDITKTPPVRNIPQKPKEGATLPKHEATKAPTQKRRGIFSGWRPVQLGPEGPAYHITPPEDGREFIEFNSDHPAYELNFGRGPINLSEYEMKVAVTAILKKENPETEDFLEKQEVIFRAIDRFLLNEGGKFPSHGSKENPFR